MAGADFGLALRAFADKRWFRFHFRNSCCGVHTKKFECSGADRRLTVKTTGEDAPYIILEDRVQVLIR